MLSDPANEQDLENALGAAADGDSDGKADDKAAKKAAGASSQAALPAFPFTAKAKGGSKKSHKLRARSTMDSKELSQVPNTSTIDADNMSPLNPG